MTHEDGTRPYPPHDPAPAPDDLSVAYARILADLDSARASLRDQTAALAAERAARRRIERAVRRWADDRGHPFATACATCMALYNISQGIHADPLLTALRWYANIGNYDNRGTPGTLDLQTGERRADMGERARAALGNGRAE